ATAGPAGSGGWRSTAGGGRLWASSGARWRRWAGRWRCGWWRRWRWFGLEPCERCGANVFAIVGGGGDNSLARDSSGDGGLHGSMENLASVERKLNLHGP